MIFFCKGFVETQCMVLGQFEFPDVDADFIFSIPNNNPRPESLNGLEEKRGTAKAETSAALMAR